jgi:hypothetical protein
MPNLHELIEQEARTNLDDIKDVPPLPPGDYLAQVVGNHENVISSRKQTAGVQFTLRLLQANESVDRDRLDSFLATSNQSLRDVTIRHTFWDSPYAMSSLRSFLKDSLAIHGELKEALSNVPGKQLVVTITHRSQQSDDGSMRLIAQIGSTARAL